MKLHIYDTSEQGDCFSAVVMAVAGIVAKENIVRYRSIADFLKGLDWNTWNEPVIIFTESDAELDQILPHHDHLSICRIVLVLHDDKKATFTKGHQLRPRILFSQPVTAETLTAVIARMVGGVPWKTAEA